MATQTDIGPYLKAISDAIYGAQVRSSIMNALRLINDDNNQYLSIKEKAEECITKVNSASTTITNLVNATNTGNTTITNLDNSVNTAETTKTQLDTSNTNATTTLNGLEAIDQSRLVTITNNANTAKANLDSSASTADSVRQNLATAITNARTAITDAEAARSNLNSSTVTANTANTNLAYNTNKAIETNADIQRAIGLAASLQGQLDDDQVLQRLISIETAVQDMRLTSYLDVDGVHVLAIDNDNILAADQSFDFSARIAALQDRADLFLETEKALRYEIAGRDERLNEQASLIEDMTGTIAEQASLIETMKSGLADAVEAASALTNRVAALEGKHNNNNIYVLAN